MQRLFKWLAYFQEEMASLKEELLEQMLACAHEHAKIGSELNYTLQILNGARRTAQQERIDISQQRITFIEQLAYENAATYNMQMAEIYASQGKSGQAVDSFKKTVSILENILDGNRKSEIMNKASRIQEIYNLQLP